MTKGRAPDPTPCQDGRSLPRNPPHRQAALPRQAWREDERFSCTPDQKAKGGTVATKGTVARRKLASGHDPGECNSGMGSWPAAATHSATMGWGSWPAATTQSATANSWPAASTQESATLGWGSWPAVSTQESATLGWGSWPAATTQGATARQGSWPAAVSLDCSGHILHKEQYHISGNDCCHSPLPPHGICHTSNLTPPYFTLPVSRNIAIRHLAGELGGTAITKL